MIATSSYKDIRQGFTQSQNLKVVVLDNTNLSFLVRHQNTFRPVDVFLPYDVILIPKWVAMEMEGDRAREEYLQTIRSTLSHLHLWVVDENEYVELIGFQDQRLYRIFLAACQKQGALRSFLLEFEDKVEQADLPADWLQRFYTEGFERQSPGQKKNAGEISILVLTYLLLHMFPNQIEHITWFSMDRDLWNMYPEAHKYLVQMDLLDRTKICPISFCSPDMLMKTAYEQRRVTVPEILVMRHQPRYMRYIISNPDGTVQSHDEQVNTEFFVQHILGNSNCRVVF